MTTPLIRPDHKAIRAYRDKLALFAHHGASHEGAVADAFKGLLEAAAAPRKWVLIQQNPCTTAAGQKVRPDGELRDEWNIPRGFWEAKDSADDLDAEVRAKIAKGYPLRNTIFEDTRRAILFQNGREAQKADLTNPAETAALLNSFFQHDQPEFERFNQAANEFFQQVPNLADGLKAKIADAHQSNPPFQASFEGFLDRSSIDPELDDFGARDRIDPPFKVRPPVRRRRQATHPLRTPRSPAGRVQ